MNRRAFELAISTMILLILGVFVLIGLGYALIGGFKNFKSNSQPFLDTTQVTSLKQACSFACDAKDRYTFCCKQYTFDKLKVNCTDTRLESPCSNINCIDFQCSS